ncbi:MAG: CDP-diacylglycerol--serine O-phosphatidyltransferase [Flavobacteriales bacterium]|nr:CDP-diacylglycerol--serine O-phosphatidyltransferase [Flavobacteriales bacterium]
MNLRYWIPNGFTLGNLLLGMIAITRATKGDLVFAAYCIALATVFDFLDGFMARMLQAQSGFGKDLDSLADMVTFGVAPSILWYNYAVHIGDHTYNYLALLLGLAAAVRLARFNNDPRQSNSFIGLPTPAAALFMISIPLILEFDEFGMAENLKSTGAVVLTPIFIALLMISPLPLFSLKFRNLNWEDNKHRYGLIVLSVGFIALFNFLAIPLIVVTYILLSLLRNFAS